MKQQQFENWIKRNQTQITDTKRYPKTITTISNHLKKQGIDEYNLFLLDDANKAKQIREKYFSINEYYSLNSRGNNMYSRAFDLYIKFLEYEINKNQISIDIQDIIEHKEIENTEKSTLIQSRIGQGFFRDQVIKLWGGCAVTGCKQKSLLVASHIKPWSKSNNQERLDPYNGLPLLPNIDKAFGLGYISFDEAGKIIISEELKEYKYLGISKNMNINLKKQNKPFMEYHRSYVFKIT